MLAYPSALTYPQRWYRMRYIAGPVSVQRSLPPSVQEQESFGKLL